MRSHGFRLLEFDFPGEEYFADIAGLVDELVKDMPREDRTVEYRTTADDIRTSIERHKALGIQYKQLLLYAPDRKLVGTSLVLIMGETYEADQRITGIDRVYRGMGLAKYLKAVMIRNIRKEFPRIPSVRTECFAQNHPIINLNLSLGYKAVANDQDYILTKEDWRRLC